ncbi:MAG: lantibiotic dehydratase family protein, partial [Holophagales bacterium]|nr:lantibiotic dehydratase family protein [Holophagales bacterium]
SEAETGGAGPGPPLLRLPAAGAHLQVSLNKAIYSLILRRLARSPGALECFGLGLNPSLRPTAGGYEMLLARDGREHWIRLPRSLALDLVIERLEAVGQDTVHDLAVRLARACGARPEQSRPHLERMVEAGILQLRTSIAEAETEWATPLRKRLLRSPRPEVRRMAELLRELEGLRCSFPGLEAEARLPALDRCRRRLRRELTDDSAEADGLEPQLSRAVERNPVYEDSYLEGLATIDAGRLGPALESLARWAGWTGRHALLGCHRANLEAYYHRAFPGRGAVPFLELYRGFFTEVFEPILAFERNPRRGDFHSLLDPYGLGLLAASQAAGEGLRERVRQRWQRWPESENLHLDRDDLEGLGRAVPPEEDPAAGDGWASAQVFVQLLSDWPNPGNAGLLADQQAVQVGLGKFFSRFLPGLDPEVGRALRRRLTDLGGRLVAELGDDGELSSNANLHPPLTEWTLDYPSAFGGVDPSSHLPLRCLDVRPDPAGRRGLQLVHRQLSKAVVPVDLGFANPLRRPPLFRVLSLFSPSAFHRISMPWTHADRDESEGVLYRPRVVFEDRVVLARRAWRVAADTLAALARGAAPARAFDALRRWREREGLPGEAFFHFPSHPELEELRPAAEPAAAGGDGAGGRNQRRRYKPQYLCFDSPALCELLLEQVGRGGGHLVLEEVLPTPNMLAVRRGRSHATELIVQLDRRAP